MRLRRIIAHRFASLFRRSRIEAELQNEIDIHIQQLAKEFRASGMTESEALLAAKREFGPVTVTQERCRDTRRLNFIDALARDVLFAARTMKKSPGFTMMALLSLALGIGANTAIYSFMDAILMRALPVPQPGNLVVLNWRSNGWPAVAHSQHGDDWREPGGMVVSGTFPYPAWQSLRDNHDSLTTLFAFADAGRLNAIVHNQAYLGGGEYVSGNYFSSIGAPPAAGRFIDDNDDKAGAAPVAVISYRFWQHSFDGAPNAIGQSMLVNRKPFTVVGVTVPEFDGLNPRDSPDIFVPLRSLSYLDLRVGRRNWFQERDNYWVEMMGRLGPDYTTRQAEAALATRFHAFVASTATNQKERSTLPQLWLEDGGSGLDALRRKYSKPLYVLISMTALILVIACANLANLLLARGTARRREIAVRLSLGAGRRRIIRQLLTESVLLSLLGGIAGLFVAAGGIRFLTWLLANGQDDFTLHAGIDQRILFFAMLISIATGIVFGFIPAIQATKVDVTPALKEARSTQHVRRMGLPFGLSHLLVAGQIALSLLLVIAAGLFVTTLAKLHSVSVGFNKENLLVFNLNAQIAGYDDVRGANFYESLRERFVNTPGVIGASMSDMPLASGSNSASTIVLPGVRADRNTNTRTLYVGPAFFETMQIPILLGRGIDEHDIANAPKSAVVNEEFAKEFLSGRNPVGLHFRFASHLQLASAQAEIQIVGMAQNARYKSLTAEIPPVAYLSWGQPPAGGLIDGLYYEVRTFGDPLALANTIRKIVRQENSHVPVDDIRTEVRYIDATIAPERTFANLCTCFGVLALVIACVGLYGTMAYAVARRTNEIGIRMALGAQRKRVLYMVLGEAAVLTGAGLIIGLGVAWQATRLVAAFLFGIRPHDVWVLSSSAIILASCALLAGAMPAWRASHIDPMEALRHE